MKASKPLKVNLCTGNLATGIESERGRLGTLERLATATKAERVAAL